MVASISSRAFRRRAPDRVRLDCGTGYFNLKIADLTPAGLSNERYLVAPRESRIDRYYYSKQDHSINPSWSPDGKRVWYVTMRKFPGARAGSARSRSRAASRMPRQASTGDVLGRAARGRPGRQADPVLELPRRPVAPALADDDRRYGTAAADLRRLRSPQRPLVAGRKAHRLHQQRERQHDALGAGVHRRRAQRSSRWTQSPATRCSFMIQPRTHAAPAISARVSVLGSDGRWRAP